MKLISQSKLDFDELILTVELTGREIALIYAGLMNLDGDAFERNIARTNYKGRKLISTSEIDTDSWFDLLVNKQR